MFVITMYFEGLKEDWFCQLGHPRKIKNLLTYLPKDLDFLSFFGHKRPITSKNKDVTYTILTLPEANAS